MTGVGEVDTGGSLGDYAGVVWRYRWLILSVTVAAMLVMFVVTASLPKLYESTASMLAPKEGAGSGFLGGLAAASGLLQQVPNVSLPSLAPNRDLLVSVLRSRTVVQAVVDRFKVQEHYRFQYVSDAIKKVRAATTVSVSKEGVISVTVEDEDPRQAAEMANFYVEQLDRLVAQYGVGEAGRQRVFLTEQLARARAGLDAAEGALRRFQERNSAVVLQEQTRGAIDAAARLKGEIMAAQVQLQVMRNFATDANPEVVSVRRRIDEMNRQLEQMQYGEAAFRGAGGRQGQFSVPFARVPEVGLELARLTRDVKVQETLMTVLAQQVEQAKINEARDFPIVQVLDSAVPAERPSKPRILSNVSVVGAGAFFVAVFLAFLLDYTKGSRRRAQQLRRP